MIWLFNVSTVFYYCRFDEMRKGEPERKIKGKKRSFRDNMDGTSKNEKVIIVIFN